MMPPSSMSRCSGLVPFSMINSAEFQSARGREEGEDGGILLVSFNLGKVLARGLKKVLP